MKYLKYLLFLSFLLQNPLLGTSQLANDILTAKGKKSNEIYFLVKESFPQNKKGNIFFNQKWSEGIITDYKNNQHKISVRYRVYQEEMQVKHNAKTKALQLQQIKKVTFGDYVFISSLFILNEEKFHSFFEVVSDGKLQLLKQYESNELNGTFDIKSHLYSKKGKTPAEKIIFKKKYILKRMDDKKVAIQQYLKKEKINLKKSEDIEKLFEYYNSL